MSGKSSCRNPVMNAWINRINTKRISRVQQTSAYNKREKRKGKVMDYGDYSDNFTTSDGTPITPNLRVFGYDMKWGNVEPWQFRKLGNENRYGVNGCDFDGWYTVVWDDGSRNIANGTRMAHKTPLSTDPTPDKRIGKDSNVECSACISVNMGTCIDADCNCHNS